MFDVSGELRVYVADDYSMYPSTASQRFSVTVRFSSPSRGEWQASTNDEPAEQGLGGVGLAAVVPRGVQAPLDRHVEHAPPALQKNVGIWGAS